MTTLESLSSSSQIPTLTSYYKNNEDELEKLNHKSAISVITEIAKSAICGAAVGHFSSLLLLGKSGPGDFRMIPEICGGVLFGLTSYAIFSTPLYNALICTKSLTCVKKIIPEISALHKKNDIQLDGVLNKRMQELEKSIKTNKQDQPFRNGYRCTIQNIKEKLPVHVLCALIAGAAIFKTFNSNAYPHGLIFTVSATAMSLLVNSSTYSKKRVQDHLNIFKSAGQLVKQAKQVNNLPLISQTLVKSNDNTHS